jgi:hypothetical protein
MTSWVDDTAIRPRPDLGAAVMAIIFGGLTILSGASALFDAL